VIATTMPPRDSFSMSLRPAILSFHVSIFSILFACLRRQLILFIFAAAPMLCLASAYAPLRFFAIIISAADSPRLRFARSHLRGRAFSLF
jgi:energy-coupling factor transporter transmembrane protein EcfT